MQEDFGSMGKKGLHCSKGFGEGTHIGLAMVLVFCLARFVELPPITSYLVVEGSWLL